MEHAESPPDPIRVFLCHSSSDKADVRELSRRLKSDGFEPWLDEERLLPGQDWHDVIQEALEHSQAILVCLSRASIEKEGYVQRELRRALDLADEKPEGTIFVVPVRLEACEIPRRLQRWQWVDMFEADGYARLRASLLTRAREAASKGGSRVEGERSLGPPLRESSAGNDGSAGRGEAGGGQRPREHILPYATISVVSFLGGVGLLGTMIWQAERIVGLGLTGNFYYVTLVPLGLSAAAFLYGLMRSLNEFRGLPSSGSAERIVPVAVFLLVLVLGFFLVEPSTSFAITVYVHGPGGHQDIVLENEGSVVVDLGPDRRKASIGLMGQAFIPGISAEFRGQNVRFAIESDAYELADVRPVSLDSSSIYLVARRLPGVVKGRIEDERGRPISGARVEVAGRFTTTSTYGEFELSIPGSSMAPKLMLHASAPGYAEVLNKTVVPNANPIVLTLGPR